MSWRSLKKVIEVEAWAIWLRPFFQIFCIMNKGTPYGTNNRIGYWHLCGCENRSQVRDGTLLNQVGICSGAS